ncbi:Glycoside hydrolase, family 19, catalytic [Corchorus capsularis]|uniref:Glycoside hydrolase, family 19, catalytic n=1 Tax=Corchorus capsularis TaxID=210143 RepID=A0A1R3G671_COCAP|nr:Glycoside hydrolase, family 19, catalytic [Corchorus capsularis]
MESKFLVFLVIAIMLAVAHCQDEGAVKPKVKIVKGKKLCDKGWECKGYSQYCCNLTISDYFQTYQFENLFEKRNTPVAHAVGFWDYHSFITAAALYQPHGFGTTGGKLQNMKEVAAFLGHVGSKTSCGYGVATGGPLAWGLCYNKEMSPSKLNYNYGKIGEALKVDLLNHPEHIENNATLAFQTAIFQWMTPLKKGHPSAHDVFVGNWKPTKNDTLAKRVPGFGTTMNVLYGDQVCGQGDSESMNNMISHYLHYLDLMGVGREEAGPHEILSCEEQEPLSVSPSSATSS